VPPARGVFGQVPNSNAAPGTEGTVYGTAPTGVAVSQYADPNTFVGPDTNPEIDADDEIAFMASDAGGRAPQSAVTPPGIAQGDGERIARLAARAADYVDYEFRLASGDYRSTYLRADGPNPESSRIKTNSYTAGFSDRWIFDQLRIRAGDAGGEEILDGYKFGFAPGSCGRSEATFSDSEGAFVANIDGPVRAVRSYIGANSGPLTERTHYFYDRRHEIATDLRVHPITGALIYHDLGEAAIGMVFLNSRTGGGAPVDGVQDTINPAVPEWRLWTGEQGSLFAADRLSSSFAESFLAQASEFYLDDSTPDFQQCWGDQMAISRPVSTRRRRSPIPTPECRPPSSCGRRRSRSSPNPGWAPPRRDAGRGRSIRRSRSSSGW